MNSLKYNSVIWPILIFLILTPFFAKAAPQAALFLSPAAGSFVVGSTLDVSVILDTKGAAINTIEVELLFPPDKLQIASPSVGQSIVQLWPAPPAFSNREGRIYFVGAIPAPGIITSQGVVMTLSFRVVSPGGGEIKFGEKTKVLAHDGRGTDILRQSPSVFFKFLVPPPLGPQISSPTHPDQERWYKDTNPVFTWSNGQYASGYSYTIDKDPAGFPDTVPEGTSATASFENLKDGIWYFHLRGQAGGSWGGVSHFVVKIDSSPPAAFKVNVSPGLRTANKTPIFRFFTTDSLSGFDHFEMKIIPLAQKIVSESLYFEVASPYQASSLETGRYQVIVRALDKAGNSQDEAITLNIVGALNQFIGSDGIDLILFFAPWSTLVNIGFILVIIVALVLCGLWQQHHHHIRHAFREDIKNIFKFFEKP